MGLRLDDLAPATQSAMFPGGKPPKAKKPSKISLAREEFALQVRLFRLPAPAVEHRFAKELGRQWRFDFCWPQYWVAFEVEGLVVQNLNGRVIVTGRHATITGMREDMEKYNTAALMGWFVLRGEQSMIARKASIATIQRVLMARGWKP